MNLLQLLLSAEFVAVSQGTTLKPNAILGHEKRRQQRSNKQIPSKAPLLHSPQKILLVLLYAGFHLGQISEIS